MPNVLDISNTGAAADSMEHIVFAAMQDLLLKILLKSASDDYELRRERQRAGIERAKKSGRVFGGRSISQKRIDDIATCKQKGLSHSETAKIIGCSVSTVKRVCRLIRSGRYKTSTN